MKKLKYILAVVSFLVIVPVIAKETFNNTNLEATSTSFTTPTFQVGDKVYIGNLPFTTLSSGTDIKLLADQPTSTSISGITWSAAQASLQDLTADYGPLAASLLKDKTTQPIKADLNAFTISDTSFVSAGTKLNNIIPTFESDWWLGDTPSNYKAYFASGDNKFEKPVTLTETAFDSSDECSTKEIVYNGVKPSETRKDEDISEIVNFTGRIKVVNTKTSTGWLDNPIDNTDSQFLYKSWGSENCTGPLVGGSNVFLNMDKDDNGDLTHDVIEVENGQLSLKYTNGYMLAAHYSIYFTSESPTINLGDEFSAELVPGVCYNVSHLTSKYPGRGNSFMLNPTYNTTTVSWTSKIVDREFTGTPKICPGQTQTAGTSFVRPYVSLPSSMVLFGNDSKRYFSTSSSLNGTEPTSDGNQFLTLQAPSLSVSLTSGEIGVSGNTITTVPDKDKLVHIPVSLSGTSEGNVYVTARGTDKNGSPIYGVLKQIDGTSGVISLDVTNLVQDPSKATDINLTLYQENSGEYNTAYMGLGTDITIKIADSQSIKFHEGTVDKGTYGSEIVLTSHLTSALAEQANSNISYSILDPNTSKANIVSQNYNASTGEASATIKVLEGTGSFEVAINKTGNATVGAATQVIKEIQLEKKAIDVTPVVPSKSYTVGDDMPVFSSTSTGLVSGDSIPISLKPILQPLSASDPTLPNSGEKIIANGKWKMVFASDALNGLTSFTDKYDVTLISYDTTHTDYVFETGISDIPTGWVVVTPDANSDGWNNGYVTLSPSQGAIDAGYTTIEVVNELNQIQKSGASIEYSAETSSTTPRVRLKKGESTSTPSNTRVLKIDLTKPNATAVVENETTWVKDGKVVTITATDALSKIKSVVASIDGKDYTASKGSGDDYTFTADKNGIATIVITDYAGNEVNLSRTISMIDNSEIALTATPKDNSAKPTKQSVAITRNPGASGIKTFKVYYKRSVGDTYIETEDLDRSEVSFDYIAEMNGFYKFELVNNVDTTKSVEVELTAITPPTPVTKIEAVYSDAQSTSYTSDTWTNHDILIKLSNINSEISDSVTWKVSSDNGGSWKAVDASNTYVVRSDSYSSDTYIFKGTSSLDVSEATGKSIKVKIDKTLPSIPVIKDIEKYVESDWFSEAVTLETEALSVRPSGIEQKVYYQVNGIGQWIEAVNGKYSVSGNGQYQVKFKVVDAAGNESSASATAYVNINSDVPSITIKLNTNPIKELLKELTFGFFFKDTINVDFEVDYGLGNTGEVFYIIEDAQGSSMPGDDADWKVGNSTTIIPDQKVMIYAKAVSKSGKIGRESSIHYVVADQTKPVIEVPDTSKWTNEDSLQVLATDETAGIDTDTLTYSANGGANTKLTMNNGKAEIVNLVDGQYTIVVDVKDYSKNEHRVSTDVKIDTVVPLLGDPSSDVVDWTKKKTITFSASDALSGIASSYPIVEYSGKRITPKLVSTGNYAFEISENDTYTIKVKDTAGNETLKTHVESMIDDIPPVISKIVVDKPDSFTASKKVTFDVVDSESGIDSVVITFKKEGVLQTVNAIASSGDEFTFDAVDEATYTITAMDKVGNASTATFDIKNIDKDEIAIKNISNINSWVKDQMSVSFEVQEGMSGLETGYPKVSFNNSPVSISQSGSKHTFDANENGTYTITLKNKAGDSVDKIIDITKIDKLAPVIDRVSSNISDTIFRDPQTITFHVTDFNVVDKSKNGSGLKSGSPRVYYMDKGTQRSVNITQNLSDKSQYSFLADKNTTYSVEAIDAVGHDVVKEDIVVDHILIVADASEVMVVAMNKQSNIASNTWVNGDVTFTLSGGLPSEVLTSYQVAVNDGQKPAESEWQNISNQASSQHIVSNEQANKTYWFRAFPSFAKAVSKPFIVNIDNTAPTNVVINVQKKNTNPIARMLNAISFGNWLKEEQEVSFEAIDNYADASQMRYLYAEEIDGKIGPWRPYTGSLSYADTNSIIRGKAIDLAGNESIEAVEAIMIDTVVPTISGVQDQSIYKQYYLPRFINYADIGSGVLSASVTKDAGSAQPLTYDHKIKGNGTYVLNVEDNAGNITILTFKIINLPSLDKIDGSDESKDIIDQVQKELEENRNKLDQIEIDDTEKWIEDATDKWNDLRKKVVENEEKTSKVEGIGDTTFDPKTVLIVDPIEENTLPTLPRKALYSYNVYLKKGNVEIQPNGDVKVYLPYVEEAEPIVYEIDDEDKVNELASTEENDHVVFVTDKLLRYAISNVDQESNEMKVPGPDGKDDTEDDVIGNGSKDIPPVRRPDGGLDIPAGGNVVYPDGGVIDTPDGGILNPDGSLTLPDGTLIDPNGDKKEPGICVVGPDGKLGTADDVCGTGNETEEAEKQPDGSVEIPPGGIVIFPDKEVELPDGGILNPDGSVTLPDGSVLDPNGDKKDPEVNTDSDGDGKPDVNVDVDCDGKADINIDIDGDGIPDINIDTTGDGKANYNIDIDGDGKADVNIGGVHKPWTPNLCVKNDCNKDYCTDSYYKPYLNIDTDKDGRPDVNLDIDGDNIPDLNVDINFDLIPELDIDSDGDGKADINVDVNGDGIGDVNLVRIDKWTPNHDTQIGDFKYDTMKGLVPVYNVDTNNDGTADKNLADNTGNKLILSGGSSTGGGNDLSNNLVGANTGDETNWSRWWLMFLIAGSSFVGCIYRKVKLRKQRIL